MILHMKSGLHRDEFKPLWYYVRKQHLSGEVESRQLNTTGWYLRIFTHHMAVKSFVKMEQCTSIQAVQWVFIMASDVQVIQIYLWRVPAQVIPVCMCGTAALLCVCVCVHPGSWLFTVLPAVTLAHTHLKGAAIKCHRLLPFWTHTTVIRRCCRQDVSDSSTTLVRGIVQGHHEVSGSGGFTNTSTILMEVDDLEIIDWIRSFPWLYGARSPWSASAFWLFQVEAIDTHSHNLKALVPLLPYLFIFCWLFFANGLCVCSVAHSNDPLTVSVWPPESSPA